MKIYHKIQNTFFQFFDFYHIKENRKNGCGIILNIYSIYQKCYFEYKKYISLFKLHNINRKLNILR